MWKGMHAYLLPTLVYHQIHLNALSSILFLENVNP